MIISFFHKCNFVFLYLEAHWVNTAQITVKICTLTMVLMEVHQIVMRLAWALAEWLGL